MHVDHCIDCMEGMLLKDVLKMGFGMVGDLVAKVRIFHIVLVINIELIIKIQNIPCLNILLLFRKPLHAV